MNFLGFPIFTVVLVASMAKRNIDLEFIEIDTPFIEIDTSGIQ